MAVPERKASAAQAGSQPIEVLEELLARRYSCRAFKPDQVPRATIERLLAAAQRTASWCNSQPWQLVITSGAETRKFRDVMVAAATSGESEAPDFPWPREYKGVYLERRRESGFQLYNTLGIPRGDKAAYARQALQNYYFFGAPHVAIVTTTEELGVYGAVDCGLYVDTFMLAAQALGLGTIAQAALARRSDVVRKYFKLGDDRRVVCGISFGYPDHDSLVNSYRTSRAKLDDVVTFVGE
jgi:nitroreductase